MPPSGKAPKSSSIELMKGDLERAKLTPQKLAHPKSGSKPALDTMNKSKLAKSQQPAMVPRTVGAQM